MHPEKNWKNSRSKSDQAPLSFAGNRSRIIFVASNKFSSQISLHNQAPKTIDRQVAKPSGRSENGSVSNSDRLPKYLAGNKGRITTVPSDYLEEFSSQMSHPHQSKTIDKWVAHPPGKSENSLVCNLDQVPHSPPSYSSIGGKSHTNTNATKRTNERTLSHPHHSLTENEAFHNTRFEIHRRFLEAKSHSNYLLSHREQLIKHFSLHGYESDY